MLASIITAAGVLAFALSPAAAADPTSPQTSIRLRVQGNSTSNAYDGFYLSPYHEGAGIADATIITNRTQGLGGAYLQPSPNTDYEGEGSILLFNSTAATGPGNVTYPFQTNFGDSLGFYDTLMKVTFNSAQNATAGFSFNQTSGALQYQNSSRFAACDWTHAPGFPTIFWQNPYFADTRGLPSNCAGIQLVREDKWVSGSAM